MNTAVLEQENTCVDIPMQVVNLNRWTVVTTILVGLVSGQPLFTTALFVVLLSAVLFGQRGSLIFQVGKRLFVNDRNRNDPGEDRRLMRFNNAVAVLLLGVAQVAFVLGAIPFGWGVSLVLVVAAGAALAGYCLGCFLYYRFKLYRYRLLGKR